MGSGKKWEIKKNKYREIKNSPLDFSFSILE